MRRTRKDADGCSLRSDSSIEFVNSESVSVAEACLRNVATRRRVAVLSITSSSVQPDLLNFHAA